MYLLCWDSETGADYADLPSLFKYTKTGLAPLIFRQTFHAESKPP